MAGKGGARPGAGRPRNAVKYADEIKELNDAIAANVLKIFAKGMELVEGIEVERIVRGNPVVYRVPPDAGMIRFFLEKLAGKAIQAVELTGEDGQDLRHAVTIYLPDNGRDKPDGDSTPGRPAN